MCVPCHFSFFCLPMHKASDNWAILTHCLHQIFLLSLKKKINDINSHSWNSDVPNILHLTTLWTTLPEVEEWILPQLPTISKLMAHWNPLVKLGVPFHLHFFFNHSYWSCLSKYGHFFLENRFLIAQSFFLYILFYTFGEY